MNKKIIISIIAGCLLLFARTSFAQNTYGDPYSRFGLGTFEEQALGKSLGMGGISAGISSPFDINPINPASYSAFLRHTFVFQVGTEIARNDYSSSAGKLTDYDVRFSSINAGFRINKFWTMSLGISPLTSIDYNLSTTDSIAKDDYKLKQINRARGEGGLTQAYIGNAFSYKGFSLGFNAAYLFGPLQKITETYTSKDNYLSSYSQRLNNKVKAFTGRVGVQYSDSIFKKDAFTVGAFYQLGNDLKNDFMRFTTHSVFVDENIRSLDTIHNDTLAQSSIILPSSLGFGFTYTTHGLTFGFDYVMTQFKSTKLWDTNLDYFKKADRTSFGVEYTNNPLSVNFLKRMSFRAGGYYEDCGLEVGGIGVSDFGLTFGFGLPVKGKAILNLAFRVGQKGTHTGGLIKDNYYMINVNLNMGENWFIRRKFF